MKRAASVIFGFLYIASAFICAVVVVGIVVLITPFFPGGKRLP